MPPAHLSGHQRKPPPELGKEFGIFRWRHRWQRQRSLDRRWVSLDASKRRRNVCLDRLNAVIRGRVQIIVDGVDKCGNQRFCIPIAIDECIGEQMSKFEYKPAHPAVISSIYVYSISRLGKSRENTIQFRLV